MKALSNLRIDSRKKERLVSSWCKFILFLLDSLIIFTSLLILFDWQSLRKKCPHSKLFWSAFSAFGLNTERYCVSPRIQSVCGKMRTRVTPDTDSFYVVNDTNCSSVSLNNLVVLIVCLIDSDIVLWYFVLTPSLKRQQLSW